MIDPMDNAPLEPPRGATIQQVKWSWAVVIALVLGLGLAFYGIDARRNVHTAANPPAIMAAPAPAAGISPPPPQTTTGQQLPAPETTGRGSNNQ
jgi:hypothetical protein